MWIILMLLVFSKLYNSLISLIMLHNLITLSSLFIRESPLGKWSLHMFNQLYFLRRTYWQCEINGQIITAETMISFWFLNKRFPFYFCHPRDSNSNLLLGVAFLHSMIDDIVVHEEDNNGWIPSVNKIMDFHFTEFLTDY